MSVPWWSAGLSALVALIGGGGATWLLVGANRRKLDADAELSVASADKSAAEAEAQRVGTAQIFSTAAGDMVSTATALLESQSLQIASLEVTIGELKSLVETQAAEIDGLHNTVAQQSREIVDLTTTVARQSEEIARLRAELEHPDPEEGPQ